MWYCLCDNNILELTLWYSFPLWQMKEDYDRSFGMTEDYHLDSSGRKFGQEDEAQIFIEYSVNISSVCLTSTMDDAKFEVSVCDFVFQKDRTGV